ncbi:MAG: hypothetical protein CSA76_01315 [Spirochaetales bacterium]|nr:MAG: hypothetical protein CSA76_01315 [Spirochaetales bacterium]
MADDSRGVLARLGLLYAAIYGTVALLYPFYPVYLSLRDLSPSRIGIILGGLELAALAAAFVLPRAADRSGRFRMVMALMVITAAGGIVLVHRGRLFSEILAASLIYGFFFRPLPALADAYSGHILRNPSAYYGRVRAGGTISFLIVSLSFQFSGILNDAPPLRFTAVFLAAMGVLVCVLPILPRVTSVSQEPAAAEKGAWKSIPSGYFPLLILMFTGNIGLAVYNAFGSLYMAQVFSLSQVSGLMALAAAPEIPIMLLSGRILNLLKHRKMLFSALLASVVRLLILALFPFRWPIALSQLTHALVFGLFLIACVDWINIRVPQRRRALGMGIFMAVSIGGAQLVGSVLGGWVLEAGGFTVLFAAGALFPLAALIWLLSDKRIGSTDSRLLDGPPPIR